MVLNFINLHKIFYILGNLEGDLIKKSFELILFILITYMVASEFTRDRRKELKYLLAAFAALSFQKIVSTVILGGVLFGNIGRVTYLEYLPIIDNTLEILALILLSNAFLFPILKNKYQSFKNHIAVQSLFPAGLFVFFATMLIIEIVNTDATLITNYWVGLVYSLIKILLLLYAVYILSVRTDVIIRYRYSVIIAFLVYLITPFLRLINIVFYESGAERLFVAEQPFPLLAVLFFTRVIYLKLVDKAFLRKRLKQEKELGKMKDKFVSVVSHELRTPLTSINLYSSLLRDGRLGKVNPKQKESLSIIKDETVRLSSLINDILDLSKLEDGKMHLNISYFDIHDFINTTPAAYLAKQKGVKVINKVPKDFRLKVDAEKFQQVLVNLLSNAAKFTDKGGKITISARTIKNKQEIIVQDTGIGITKESLAKIFDKFYQVEHYMTRKEGGSGLGLSIAYEIIKLHKGDIKVQSEVGKGTKFMIILPKD